MKTENFWVNCWSIIRFLLLVLFCFLAVAGGFAIYASLMETDFTQIVLNLDVESLQTATVIFLMGILSLAIGGTGLFILTTTEEVTIISG